MIRAEQIMVAVNYLLIIIFDSGTVFHFIKINFYSFDHNNFLPFFLGNEKIRSNETTIRNV